MYGLIELLFKLRLVSEEWRTTKPLTEKQRILQLAMQERGERRKKVKPRPQMRSLPQVEDLTATNTVTTGIVVTRSSCQSESEKVSTQEQYALPGQISMIEVQSEPPIPDQDENGEDNNGKENQNEDNEVNRKTRNVGSSGENCLGHDDLLTFISHELKMEFSIKDRDSSDFDSDLRNSISEGLRKLTSDFRVRNGQAVDPVDHMENFQRIDLERLDSQYDGKSWL